MMEPPQAANAQHDLFARAPVADRKSVKGPLKVVVDGHDRPKSEFLTTSEMGRLLKSVRGGR